MRFSGKTLLTIDDEPALRRSLRNYFEDSDFVVLEAENGRVGIELFRRERPDVILCDLRMPEMDGLEVINIIAAEAPEIPLIVVSGTGLIEDATAAIRLGAWDYITKPLIDMGVVEHVVNKALEKAELLAVNRQYQKRLEELLQERTLALDHSQNLVETLFSSMPGILFIYEQVEGGDFELVRWNQRGEKLLGYTAEELKGSSMPSMLSENEVEEIPQRIEMVFNPDSNGGITPREYLVKCKDGHRIPLLITSSGMSFNNKKYLVGFGIDISEKKRTEKELLLRSAAIEQAAEEIVITDPDGVIQFVNSAFEEVTGYRSNDVLGENPRILKSGFHDEKFYQELWDTVTAGRIWRGRFVNRRADGTQFTEDAVISPVYDRDGKPMGYVSVKRDITEQLKFEERRQQSQRMEAMATLAGGIAHDFNNILAAIIGSNDIALLYCEDNPRIKTSLRRIESASQRAKELVQQILAFGRPEREGEISMEPAPVVKEALKLLRASIPATINIQTNIVSRQTIKADPTKIHQVVMNLGTNAFHAMRETGGILGVELTDFEVLDPDLIPDYNLKPGKYIKLEVSDTGHGMSPETRKKIFVPYFTTKSAGDGTGLGLAVVHGIIKNCGGTIVVYSEIGKGTVFRIFLPIIDESPAACSDSPDATMPPRGCGEMIAVVDDEQYMVEVLEEVLQEHGYRVAVFNDGAAAYAAFKENPDRFDLLFSDMEMPGLHGKELASRVLALRPGLPVIISTGFSSLLSKEEALQLGVAAFLQKPVSLNEILRTVHRALKG